MEASNATHESIIGPATLIMFRYVIEVGIPTARD